MSRQYLCVALALAALPLFVLAQANSSTPRASRVPRMADGKPDMQGVWANNSATPLERPKELAARARLTDEEVARMKIKATELYNGKGDAAFGDTIFATVWASVTGGSVGPHVKADDEFDAGTGDYSSEWIVAREWDNRTSLVTDPPDGRIPPVTAEGQARRKANSAALAAPAEGPEDRGLGERCISYGSPQLTTGYQSYYQLVQTSKAVLFQTEMIHDARNIRLDGSPHLAAVIRQWHGDSRGHWEGDTLVVDTTNYKPRAFMAASTDKLHVTERFTLTAADMLEYAVTIDDPGMWTKPWSLMMRLRRADHPVLEYACHEGNIGLAGILAGARRQEQTAATTATPQPR